jgi:predicted acylesterase/phospholipase RssA
MIEVKTLCISGGGIKGLSYCGVFEKLQELHMNKEIILNIQKLCCVSVGCIFGLIYILGYNIDEIKEELLDKNFSELKDIRIKNFFTGYGLDSGKNIVSWIETLMIKKGFSKNITFKEVYDKTGVDFQVVATNLETYKYTMFNWKSDPKMKVTKGIRLSISIPFIFTAERYNGQVYVDGGVLNNYPIEHVMDDIETVLGFRLMSYECPGKKAIENFEGFVSNLVASSLYQREKIRLEENLQMKTIYIYTNVANSMNFQISAKEKEELMKVGYEATEIFFKNLNKKNLNIDGRVQ